MFFKVNETGFASINELRSLLNIEDIEENIIE